MDMDGRMDLRSVQSALSSARRKNAEVGCLSFVGWGGGGGSGFGSDSASCSGRSE